MRVSPAMHTNQIQAIQRTLLNVTGMHCGSCRRRIGAALEQVEGVEQVAIDLAKGEVSISHSPAVAVERLVAAVEAEGYGARPG